MHITRAYYKLIRNKVKAKYQQKHRSQQEGNWPDLFFKNNTYTSQNKQGSGNISKHQKAGNPGMHFRY